MQDMAASRKKHSLSNGSKLSCLSATSSPERLPNLSGPCINKVCHVKSYWLLSKSTWDH